MDAAHTPEDAVCSGDKNSLAIPAGFDPIPGAVSDASSKPVFRQFMELAISPTECTDAIVAADMGVS